MTPARVWTALAVLYALFFSWYTSFGGPLTPEEITSYRAVLAERDGDAERLAVWTHFMETDTGDDFVMFNALDLRDTPQPVEGVEPGETSADVMSKYTTPFMAKAMRNGAHPVFYGNAAAPAMDIWGIEGANDWTTGGLVRYRSRRDLLEQATSIGPSGIHEFKIAALEKTVAYPLDPFFYAGDPRLLLGLFFAVIGLLFHLRAALKPR
jgi:hypothetical protein